VVWVAAFRTPGYRNPDTARTVGSGGDSQPSISSKVRFRVSGFEESKDLTLFHRCVAKCERRLLSWLVVITNDHMEVDKGRASLR
jgi:hypothetical protein